MGMASASKHPRIPLKTRLKVWWEGYDMNDVEARLRAIESRRAKPEPVKARAAPPPIDEDLPINPWDEKRIEIAQYIWGEGYCGPGGPEHIVSMSKLLAMSPEMSALVLGAGLGGPARVLAQEFGVWITGVEASEKLAAAGMELSIMHGMAKKAPIRTYNPEEPEEFERNFDRAFAKEALYTVKNKKALVKQVSANLKKDGLFLITDFFLADGGKGASQEIRDRKEKEAQKPYLTTVEDMVDILEASGFTIRVNEDISDQYISMIAKAWAEADKVVAKLKEQGEEGKALIEVLMREAEHWSDRSRLLEKDFLQVHRILAAKKVTKTMSDW
ncbi:MAG: methyltransferase domain-containing protein [Alphaproteobacteria bacterium]|nr:MAG: methyltransferase domain-containing protein [Alphaproteobacteria bacterium]